MILAIDMDDTIMNTKDVLPGYRMGQPVKGAITAIKRLHNSGHTIIIFTARNVQVPSAYKAVEDWLNYFDIPFHGITNIKRPEFDLMIDNRALHFDDWAKTLWRINNMHNDEYQFTHTEGID